MIQHWWVGLLGIVGVLLLFALTFGGGWRSVRGSWRWAWNIWREDKKFAKQAEELRASAEDLRKQAEEATDQDVKDRLNESARKLDSMADRVDRLKDQATDMKATEISVTQINSVRDAKAAVARAVESAYDARQAARHVVTTYARDSTQEQKDAADANFDAKMKDAQEKIDAARERFETK